MRFALCSLAFALVAAQAQPYKILKSAKAGGTGGFDYVYADADGRRLYVARGAIKDGPPARVNIFDLDTLEPVGEIPNTNARGAAVDTKNHHAFASSKPVAMWDAKTNKLIKTIDVEGAPDGILADHFNNRIYIWSHRAPNTTVIDGKTGDVLGTIDLEGAPEQAVTDGKGKIWVDIEDKGNVAVIDAKTMKVTAHYDLGNKDATAAGLAFDEKNRILFVACRQPAPGVMVMMNADTGKIIATLPLDGASDGAVFNPKTMEVFSSAGNGKMTVIKEKSPTSFEVEQTVETMVSAKTLTFDAKTGHVLLIGAEYGPPPTPAAAGGRPARGPMVPDSFTILVVGK